MDKNTILDYVIETPGNTNRAVLESILDEYVSESGEGGELDSLFTKIEVTLAVDEQSTDDIEFTLSGLPEVGANGFCGFVLVNDKPFFILENMDMSPATTETIPVYILKNESISLSFDSSGSVATTITGEAEKVINKIIISGDCTITATTDGK